MIKRKIYPARDTGYAPLPSKADGASRGLSPFNGYAQRMKLYLLVVAVLFLRAYLPERSWAQELSFKGQAIGWVLASQMEDRNAGNPADVHNVWRGQAGLRYLPDLQLQVPVQKKYSFDAELSANAFGTGLLWSRDSIAWDGKLKPYRAWMKFSGNRFEIRGGLQKINFGSASILRPLMWFDRIDPRDPLQLTDGVWGLLGRYYFLNNANIWVWGLYGNDRTKGWEILPTVQGAPEFGFRAQVPFPGGEIATTYHYRVADVEKVFPIPYGESPHAREKRLAIDGKFDYVVGFWFEAVLVHQDIHIPDLIPELRYRRMLNLGVDYTFELGNGLHLMSEFFTYGSSEYAFGNGEEIYFTALSGNYSFNIFNSLNAIFFYDWTNGEIYNFVNWSWQFDKWSFYIMGFWNPKQFDLYQGLEGTNLYAGRGLQLMVVFNH